MVDNSRLDLLARVASLYYDQHKKQDEIAMEIGMTRSAVSRLLTKAEEMGIVEHIVHYPWRTVSELEKTFYETFKLKHVSILMDQDKSYNEVLQGIGVLAAQYLTTLLPNLHSIGVSWGTGLYHMIRAFRPQPRPDLEVVQLLGGTGSERGSAIGPLVAPNLANSLSCSCRFLHAPLIMKNENARNAILEDETIRQTLQMASNCDIAVVGIGCTLPEFYNPYRLGYLTQEEMDQVQESGLVGDVSGIHYDILGNYRQDQWINNCWIGIDYDTLKRIPLVMGVAGGTNKAKAIYGALLGGYVNILFTNDSAARQVLELHHAYGPRSSRPV